MTTDVWPPRDAGKLVLIGLLGLTGALTLRVGVAGREGAQSIPAGVVFACALVAIVALLGMRWQPLSGRALAIGVFGAGALCLGPIAAGQGGALTGTPPMSWAAVVTAVAVAEELLLRGALFDQVTRWRGEAAAVLVTALAFALIHLPLYGAEVLPLDFAVGVWLGALRMWARSVVAPAAAHALADIAGWWLR